MDNKTLELKYYVNKKDATLYYLSIQDNIKIENQFMAFYDSSGQNFPDKHTNQIPRRLNTLRNGEKLKMHKIDWCEGGMQLADIATKNVGENVLNTRIKYIMVSIDN